MEPQERYLLDLMVGIGSFRTDVDKTRNRVSVSVDGGPDVHQALDQFATDAHALKMALRMAARLSAALLLAVALIAPGCSVFKGRPTTPEASQARTAKWVDVGRYGSSGPRFGGPRYPAGKPRGR
jgi:hypothetical protein